jgi:hypothetical protein
MGLGITGVVLLAACSGDAGTVFTADPGHNAFVRFVNAIPDSGSQDWKFVDAVEGSPTVVNMGFRGIFPGATYQAATAGTRHLRIFQSPLDQTYADPNLVSPAIVSTVFVDSTFQLAEGQHYTLMAVGSLRAKTAKLVILTDNFTDPGSSVAVRVVNAGAGASLDVYSSATGGTSALPSTRWQRGSPRTRRLSLPLCPRAPCRFAPSRPARGPYPPWSMPPLRPASPPIERSI